MTPIFTSYPFILMAAFTAPRTAAEARETARTMNDLARRQATVSKQEATERGRLIAELERQAKAGARASARPRHGARIDTFAIYAERNRRPEARA